MPRGQTLVLTIHTPLPLEFVGELMRAVGEVCEQYYRDPVAKPAGNGDIQCLVGERKTWEERLEADRRPEDEAGL